MTATPRRRVVLVTGASSGIGEALARVLAAQGDTVALVARRKDRLDAVLADCRATSPDSDRWVADLSVPDAAADLALAIWDQYDSIDAVANNARPPLRRPQAPPRDPADHGGGRTDDGHQLLLARRHQPGAPPPHARAPLRHHRQRL